MEAGPSSGRIQVGANGLVGTLVFVSETEYESRFGKADTYTGWVKATQAGEPGYLLPESKLARVGEGIQVGANGLVGTLVFVSEPEYESRFGKADTYTGWVKATQAGEPGYLLPESMLRREPRRRSRSSGQPEANDKAPCSVRTRLPEASRGSAGSNGSPRPWPVSIAEK